MTTKKEIIEDVKKILSSLNETERKLFTKIIMVERDNLHLSKPKIKDELLKAVKEVVK